MPLLLPSSTRRTSCLRREALHKAPPHGCRQHGSVRPVGSLERSPSSAPRRSSMPTAVASRRGRRTARGAVPGQSRGCSRAECACSVALASLGVLVSGATRAACTVTSRTTAVAWWTPSLRRAEDAEPWRTQIGRRIDEATGAVAQAVRRRRGDPSPRPGRLGTRLPHAHRPLRHHLDLRRHISLTHCCACGQEMIAPLRGGEPATDRRRSCRRCT